MSKTLGVFYQAYNNRKATDFVLHNFRKHFPDNEVVLISDGGDDFSDLGKQYDCKYYYFDNIFKNFKNKNGNKSQTYDQGAVLEWYRRQKLTCDIIKSDYIMILEDDVFVRDKFSIEDDFDLRGVMGPKLSHQLILEIRKSKGSITGDRYGMCGGSIYNRKMFIDHYDHIVKDIELNHDIYYEKLGYHSLGAVDANMVYQFCKRGYHYEESPWLTQVKDNPPNKNSYPLLHQYKIH